MRHLNGKLETFHIDKLLLMDVWATCGRWHPIQSWWNPAFRCSTCTGSCPTPVSQKGSAGKFLRGSSWNLEFRAAEAGLPAIFIIDLLLLLVRLEAGSGAFRDFLGSRPVSKSREPSRRRFEAAGNASLNKNSVTKTKTFKPVQITIFFLFFALNNFLSIIWKESYFDFVH